MRQYAAFTSSKRPLLSRIQQPSGAASTSVRALTASLPRRSPSTQILPWAAAVLAALRARGAVLGVGGFERCALHREELRAAVAVEREGRIVPGDEAAG